MVFFVVFAGLCPFLLVNPCCFLLVTGGRWWFLLFFFIFYGLVFFVGFVRLCLLLPGVFLLVFASFCCVLLVLACCFCCFDLWVLLFLFFCFLLVCDYLSLLVVCWIVDFCWLLAGVYWLVFAGFSCFFAGSACCYLLFFVFIGGFC